MSQPITERATMFLVFNVYSGKMVCTAHSEEEAKLLCSNLPGTDYNSMAYEFDDMLKCNRTLDSLHEVKF